ncbi:MAG: hypothetical protein QXY87_09220 [Saccharolobus sp.]|uniref:hypothetical protein n=1 Tax=Saccharolobus TaxID=2100760 RepID=UPI001F10D4A9|nr:hypothetical protein [Saccharolobus shibatae]MCH4816828.1 hypothetical protein [Saccharolobus shibatae]
MLHRTLLSLIAIILVIMPSFSLLYKAETHNNITDPTNIYIVPDFFSADPAMIFPYNDTMLGIILAGGGGPELSVSQIYNLSYPYNQVMFNYPESGPFELNVSYDNWSIHEISLIALPTVDVYPTKIYNSSLYLGKALLSATYKNIAIIVISYKDFSKYNITLSQYPSHILQGTDGIGLFVIPPQALPWAYGKSVNSSVIQQTYVLQNETNLIINGNDFGSLTQLGLYEELSSSVQTLEFLNSTAPYSSILIDSINNTIEAMANRFTIDNQSIDNSIIDLAYSSSTLTPGEQEFYAYIVSFGGNITTKMESEVYSILPKLVSLIQFPSISNQSSTIIVSVFNVLNRPATKVPGVVYGFLYNSSGLISKSVMNSNSELIFNASPGTYVLYVYHYPNLGLNYTEYWGQMRINVRTGINKYNFTRNDPWIYNIIETSIDSQFRISVKIINPLNQTVSGQLYLWISNRIPSSVSAPTFESQLLLNPGVNSINYTYSISSSGSYYVYAVLKSFVSNPEGEPIATDQYNWTSMGSVSISNTSTQTVTTTFTVTQTTVNQQTITSTVTQTSVGSTTVTVVNGFLNARAELLIITISIIVIVFMGIIIILFIRRTK